MRKMLVIPALVGLVNGCAALPAGAPPETAPPAGTQAAADQPRTEDDSIRMNFGFLEDLQMTSTTSSVALPFGPAASPSKQVVRTSEKELKDV